MHRAALCRHAVSVCLSVSFVDCVKTNKHIFKIFAYSQTILVFAYQSLWRYSNGDPGNGGVEYRGYEKIAIFDQYLAISRERYNIGPYMLVFVVFFRTPERDGRVDRQNCYDTIPVYLTCSEKLTGSQLGAPCTIIVPIL